MENKKILNVENLNKYFKSRGVLKHVLNDVSFSVDEGDFYGIIGESGSGKTTLGKVIIRLIDASGGNVYFLNKNISTKNFSKSKKQWLTNNMQMIFQDPLSSLNPNMNIIKLISEPLEINKEIFKKVKKVIDEKIIFNQYYKYDFLLKTKKIASSNTIEFYYSYNRILKNQIDKSSEFSFSDPDSWVSSYNEVEKIYEDILNEQKNLVPFFENIINHNSTVLEKMLIKLENKELEQDFLDYYSLKTEQKSVLEPVENALNLWNYEIEELNNLKKEFAEIAFKKLIKNDYKDAFFNHKFNKTNASLAKTKVDYLKFKLLADKAKIKKHLLEKILKYKYVTESKCQEILNKIYIHFEKIYEKADLKFKDIDSQKNYAKILKFIETKFSFEKVSSFIFNIFEKKIVPQISKINLLEKQKHQELLAEANKKIATCKEKYYSLRHSMKEESLKDFEKKNIQNQLIVSKVLKAFNKFKADFEKYLEEDYKTDQIKISELKKINKKLKKEIHKIAYSRLKLLIDLRPKNLSEFSLKEKTILLKNNKKTFQNQIKLKKSSISIIDWEFNNTIENTSIYEDLFSTSKQILKLHKSDLVKLLTLEEIYKSLESVGLKKEHAYRYPHEFSGGQRQRIVIARALINKPKLIIADEAISALDVSVQAQVINIMKNFSTNQGMTFLFIAHDLSMVRNICNKVIIMHNGRIVEKGLVSKIFENPIHPYTIALFKAIPEIDKMHVDLASFNVNHDYDKHYSSSNVPRFYEISSDHEILATEKQYQKWVK